MLPVEAKLSIPIELSSLQNTVIQDGNQLLSSNLNKHTLLKQHRHRNVNDHIPSAWLHEYTPPFQSEWDINNKMRNESNGQIHQFLPFSVSLNPSFTSQESSVFNPNCNEVHSTQTTDYKNYIQSCHSTNHHMLTPPPPIYSSPTALSSSSITTTSTVPLVKTNQKYIRRMYRPPVEQQLSQYPNISAQPIFSNHWSSLPLPSMADTLVRPNECRFPVDLTRTSNLVPLSLADSLISSDSPSTIIDRRSNSIVVQQHSLPHSAINTFGRHQTSGQSLIDHRCNHVQKTINHRSTSNLSHNLPYFLTTSRNHYYMLPSYPMSINIPSVTCTTLLPGLDTTLSSLPFPNNMKKVRKKRDDSQTSKIDQNPTVEVQIDEKNLASTPLITKIPDPKRRLQRKSKIEDNRTKTLIKRMKQKNKMTVLKFMMRKRKQQQRQISKKQLPEVKIEKVIPSMVASYVSKPVEIESTSTNIIASSLKITFNAARKIEFISLYYHQQHKSEIESQHSLITSNNTENKLDLLIEAVNLIEMHHGSSKLALESLE